MRGGGQLNSSKITPQARYKKAKVQTRRVDFYPHDTDILEFSHKINFASFVKTKLKEAIKEYETNGKTDISNA